MSQQVDAIYDSGVLRLLEPLAIPDQARVKVTVESPSAGELNDQTIGVKDAERVHLGEKGGQLTAAELLKLASVHAPPPEFFDADEDRPW
jgi:predicted DNA-binding antitoxin AbrB/MazE fold protein